jgi:hypothetical protein
MRSLDFRSVLIIAAVFSFTGLQACASKHSDAPLKALSADEAARFKSVLQSMGEVLALGNDLKARQSARPFPQGTGRPPRGFPQLFGAPQASGVSAKLQKAIDDNDCSVHITLPEDTNPDIQIGQSTIPRFKAEVTGGACPIRYSVSIDAVQTGQSIDANFKLTYEAVALDAKKASDVDLLNYTGLIHVDMAQEQHGSDISQSMAARFQFAGTGHSQLEGDFTGDNGATFNMNLTMSGQTQTMPVAKKTAADLLATMLSKTLLAKAALADTQLPPGGFPGLKISGEMGENFKYQFKALAGELKSSMKFDGAQQSAEYFINGVATTANDYASYRNSINFPGMNGNSTDTGTTPPFPGEPLPKPLVCQVAVYRSSQALHFATPVAAPTGPALRTYQACSNTKTNDVFNDTTVNISFSYDADKVHITTDLCTASSCVTADRYFLLDEDAEFADAAGDYTVQTSCHVAETCASAVRASVVSHE